MPPLSGYFTNETTKTPVYVFYMLFSNTIVHPIYFKMNASHSISNLPIARLRRRIVKFGTTLLTRRFDSCYASDT